MSGVFANIILKMQPGLIYPGVTLLIGLTIWLLWPKKGIWARLLKARLVNQRILLEDTLKFLFDCEYKNITCDMNSIAGNLNISGDKVAELVERLHKNERPGSV